MELPPLSKLRGVNEPLLPVLSRMSHELNKPARFDVHVTVTVPVLSRAVALVGSYEPKDNAVADTLQLSNTA